MKCGGGGGGGEGIGCVCERELRSIPSALNYHSSTVCVFIPVCFLMCVAAPTTPPNGE